MDNKLNKKTPLYQAYVLMEEGDKHEKEEEYVYAIFKYQNAAEILEEIGVSYDKIKEVDKRIQTLEGEYQIQKNEIKNQTIQLKLVSQWIEISIELERNEDYQKAIQCYEKVLGILKTSELDSSLFVKIEESKNRLRNKLKDISISGQENLIAIHEPSRNISTLNNQSINFKGKNQNKLHEYKIQKELTEKLQKEAFDLLDDANKLVKSNNPDIDNAIKLYKKSHEILISAGWTSEAETIQVIIEDLTSSKEKIKDTLETKKKLEEITKNDFENVDMRKQILRDQEKNRMLQLREFQKRKIERINTEKIAFDHINRANNQKNLQNFNIAIDEFKQAIEMFRKIGWNEQIDIILKEIDNLQDLSSKKEKDLHMVENLKKLEENDKAFLLKQKIEKDKMEVDQLKEISSMLKITNEKISKQNLVIREKKSESENANIKNNEDAEQVKNEIRKIAEKIKKSKEK